MVNMPYHWVYIRIMVSYINYTIENVPYHVVPPYHGIQTAPWYRYTNLVMVDVFVGLFGLPLARLTCTCITCTRYHVFVADFVRCVLRACCFCFHMYMLQANFRGSLSLEHEATRKAYDLLDRAASDLCSAVKEDFPNAAQVSQKILLIIMK